MSIVNKVLTEERRRYNAQRRWLRSMAARIGRMTPEKAKAVLETVCQEARFTGSADLVTVRELTGGYSSQSINEVVKHRLYERAAGIRRSR